MWSSSSVKIFGKKTAVLERFSECLFTWEYILCQISILVSYDLIFWGDESESSKSTEDTKKDTPLNDRCKHNRSSKIAVQGLVFVAHPLYIHT
jgi:hypothetical protein